MTDEGLTILEEIKLEVGDTLTENDKKRGSLKFEFLHPSCTAFSGTIGENYIYCNSIGNGTIIPLSLDISLNHIETPTGFHHGSYGQTLQQTVLFGGLNEKDEISNVTYLWNHQTKVFDPLSCDGEVPSARTHHSGVFIQKCYIVWGGKNETECLNDLYCLNDKGWIKMEQKGDVPPARYGHSMISRNDCLILTGGCDFEKTLFDDLHVYQFGNINKWTRLSSNFKIPRMFHTTLLIGDRVCIVGGKSFEKSIQEIVYFPHHIDLRFYESKQQIAIDSLINIKDLKGSLTTIEILAF
jgi:hypothetical protein